VIESLNMLEGVPLKGWNDPQALHGCGDDAAHFCRSRCVSADPDSSDVPSLIDVSVLREGTRHDRSRESVPSTSVKAGVRAPAENQQQP
jgi:hypothetical protein